jgi:hypothetical protein
MLLLRPGLLMFALLLFLMVLLVPLLLMLRAGRNSDSKKQRQSPRCDDSKCFHKTVTSIAAGCVRQL